MAFFRLRLALVGALENMQVLCRTVIPSKLSPTGIALSRAGSFCRRIVKPGDLGGKFLAHTPAMFMLNGSAEKLLCFWSSMRRVDWQPHGEF